MVPRLLRDLAERLRAVREKVFWTTPIYIYMLQVTCMYLKYNKYYIYMYLLIYLFKEYGMMVGLTIPHLIFDHVTQGTMRIFAAQRKAWDIDKINRFSTGY